MPVRLDEFPIHRVAESMRDFLTSDPNAYDRCIMPALDRSGDRQLAAGIGVYPGVGVIDGYVAIRCGGAVHGIEVDLTRQAAVPATDEPRHIRRRG